jgi:hypothetical protein
MSIITNTNAYPAFERVIRAGKTGIPEWLAIVAELEGERAASFEQSMIPIRARRKVWDRAHQVVTEATRLIQAGSFHVNLDGSSHADPALVRQGNEQLNALADELGVDYVRDLDNKNFPSTFDYANTVRPEPPISGNRISLDARDYRKAVDQIITEATLDTITKALDDYRASLK